MANVSVFEFGAMAQFKKIVKQNSLNTLSNNGAFSRVCVNPEKSSVYMISVCPIKRCIAEENLYDEFDMLPQIHEVQNDQCSIIYKMPYYHTSRAVKKMLSDDQYDIYKMLVDLCDKFIATIQTPKHNNHNNYSILFNLFDQIENADVRDQMLGMLDCFANWTHKICFEISPRNVAEKDGKLVLLDCFYCVERLTEIRSGKRVHFY